MRKFLKNQKGFTLVELMMVIAVIGILAAFLVPKIGAAKDTARLSAVESNFRQVQAQVEGLIVRNRNEADKFKTALESATSTLENPFKLGSVTDAREVIKDGTIPASPVNGKTYIEVDPDILSTSKITKVTITSYDNSSTPAVLATVEIKP